MATSIIARSTKEIVVSAEKSPSPPVYSRAVVFAAAIVGLIVGAIFGSGMGEFKKPPPAVELADVPAATDFDWSKKIVLFHRTGPADAEMVQEDEFLPFATVTADGETMFSGPRPLHGQDVWVLSFGNGSRGVYCTKPKK